MNGRGLTPRLRLGVVGAGALAVASFSAAPPAGAGPPQCGPGTPAVELSGMVAPEEARTYKLLPFEVQPGTTRVEVGYSWADRAPVPSTPITQTVFDLGLWDEKGYKDVAGFRGWSGSRHGKLHEGQKPVFVQADKAERSFRAARVRPGTWHVELGVAAVGPSGATWRVVITCSDPPVGATPEPDPVDVNHVARAAPGWFHGDFHMHGYHSNPRGPSWDAFVDYARAAKLDFLPVTEYVVGWHWDELGAAQRANPDLLIWPGREIITYFGHAIALGETRRVIDYRHGFEDVTLAEIQRQTKADQALFQVAHPTIFPGPLFQNFCRGCEFTLGDHIDWNQVDAIEVLTGPSVVDLNDADGRLPATPVGAQNPFMESAIDLWESLLMRGFEITAVSGSDSKGQEPGLSAGYGSSATAVYAEKLSRTELVRGIEFGHVYVRARGVDASPSLELVAKAGDQVGMFGDTFYASSAEVTVTVRKGAGQLLRISRNGDVVGTVPVTSDPFAYTFTATRIPDEGPLGTFWRVDTLDSQSLTTIANPIFLADRRAVTGRSCCPSPSGSASGAGGPSGSLPATGGSLPWGAVLVTMALTALVLLRPTRR